MSETPPPSNPASPSGSEPVCSSFETARALFEELCEASAVVREERLRSMPAELGVLVRELLAEDEAPRAELEQPFAAVLGRRGTSKAADSAPLPERIGHYRILELLGVGGMGVVYRARQDEPERVVALKMPRAGALSSDRARRFRFEANVLARLDHPGIARIYEAGTVDLGGGPEPWFAMELVDGVPLHEYARDRSLSERVELLAKVCDAVQHAHTKGVVHRDLKPGNILVDAEGQPRVLDFGTARTLGGETEFLTSMHTREGVLMGTLPYMSPEQLGTDPDGIDTRADVYALGVLCYQVLAGVLPHDLLGCALHQAARIVAEDEPTTLGALDPQLRGDVETIVGKAMAKDAERRYATADELGGDLRRFLRDEPILARRPTATYQLSKLVRRHRVGALGIAAALLTLVAGTVTSTALYFEKERERRGAVEALAATEAAREEEQAARLLERAARDEAERARERESAALAEALRAEQQEQRARQHAEQALALREEVLTRLVEVLSAPTPWSRGSDVRMIDVLDSALERSRDAFVGSPDARARLLFAFGSTYGGLGLSDRAIPLLDEAARLFAEAGAPESDLWGVRVEAGYERARLGDPAGIAELEHAQAWFEANPKARDIDPNDRIRLGARLCEVLQLGPRISEAEAPGLAAVELAVATESERRSSGTEVGAKERDQVLAHYFARKALGDLYGRQGRWTESSQARNRALELALSIGSRIHEILARNSLAHAFVNLGRAEQAAELMDEALAGMRGIGAESHRFYGIQLSNAAFVRTELGQYERALELYEESLAHSRLLHKGQPGSEEAITLGNLGNLLLQLDRIDEAVARGRESVAMLAGLFGPGDLRFANSLGTLALALQESGEYAEAAEAFAEALVVKRANVPNHPSIAVNLERRAEALLAAGDWSDCMRVAREARSQLERTGRGLTGEFLRVESCLALAASCLGDHERAFRGIDEIERLSAVWSSPDAELLAWSRAVRGLVIFAAGGEQPGRAAWDEACEALSKGAPSAHRRLDRLRAAVKVVGIEVGR